MIDMFVEIQPNEPENNELTSFASKPLEVLTANCVDSLPNIV